MKAPKLGEPKKRASGWYIRVRFPDGCRDRIDLGPPGMSAAMATEQVRLVAEGWASFVAVHEREHEVEKAAKRPTVRQHGEAWTSGALARTWPQRVKAKKTAADDQWRLAKHVYPHIGDKPVDEVTLEDCENVLASMPPALSDTTRRHVAQLLVHLFKLAAYPCKYIAATPLPEGFLPAKAPRKALAYLYPSEDARLLGCDSVPLAWRMVYGILAREGLRAGELDAMTWGDLDLEFGSVRLDENKTDDPRSWALQPDVAEALRVWRDMLATRSADLVEPAARVIVGLRRGKGVDLEHGAIHFRDHLTTAGVARPELYERSASRQPIRLHDLRATFVTVSLANGRTDAWVTDRTGHSLGQLEKYRRAARHHHELGLGPLRDMTTTIPELTAWATTRATRDRVAAEERENPECTRGESNPQALRRRILSPSESGDIARKPAKTALRLVSEVGSRPGLSARKPVGVGHDLGHVAMAVGGLALLWDALEEEVAELASGDPRSPGRETR